MITSVSLRGVEFECDIECYTEQDYSYSAKQTYFGPVGHDSFQGNVCSGVDILSAVLVRDSSERFLPDLQVDLDKHERIFNALQLAVGEQLLGTYI